MIKCERPDDCSCEFMFALKNGCKHSREYKIYEAIKKALCQIGINAQFTDGEVLDGANGWMTIEWQVEDELEEVGKDAGDDGYPSIHLDGAGDYKN